ncbi:MAG: GTP 3',8-cyclase MoaA [Pseudomonadota bacterium]
MRNLIDKFGRKINYLRISITDRCNLRCVYCMPFEAIQKISRNDILSYEEFLRIAEIAVKKGISKIRITGGEPLVRKGVTDFIHSLSGIAGIQDISLTTNGVSLKDFASGLFGAGLRRINVSIDSLNYRKFQEITGGGSLKEVWKGIKEAMEVGLLPIKINTVVIRGVNDDEVIDFAKLSIDNPYHIRFIEFMPVGSTSAWSEDKHVSFREIKEKIEGFGKLSPIHTNRDDGAGPAQMFRIDGAMGEIGFISPLSNHFCSSCNRLRLTADGKLRTCLLSDREVDLMPVLRGNPVDSELERLIESAILNKPEKHHFGEEIFKKCSRDMSAIGG